MVGHFIRNNDELLQMGKNTYKYLLIFQNGMCKPWNIVLSKTNINTYYLFNNFDFGLESSAVNTENLPFIDKYEYVYHNDLNGIWQILQIDAVYCLPDNIDKDIADFEGLNKKKAYELRQRYVGSYNNTQVYFSFCMCQNNFNIYSWLVRNFFKYGISFALCYQVMSILNKYGQTNLHLSRGSCTSYNGTRDWIELLNELTTELQRKTANHTVMEFNTAQKHLLKNPEIFDNNLQLLTHFGKLSDIKRKNFIQKVSTFENAQDIIHHMKILCAVHYNWNIDSFKEFLTNIDQDFNIVFDKNNICVLKVTSYEVIKRIAKTTNWCISKNKRYWNNYLDENNEQYVLLNFNKAEDDFMSIVGFTVSKKESITHAHNFINNSILPSRQPKAYETTFAHTQDVQQDILNLLNEYNIPLNLFIEEINFPFEWTREGLFNYFKRHTIQETQYDILKDDNNLLVFQTDSQTTYRMFASLLEKHHLYRCKSEFFIIFCDFNQKETSDEKLYLVQVSQLDIDIPHLVLDTRGNETALKFEDLCSMYSLPFDIINRPNSIAYQLHYYISNYCYFGLNTILKNAALDKAECVNFFETNKCERQNISKTLFSTVFSLFTFDYFNIIYNNGLTLTELFGKKTTDEILSRFIIAYRQYSHGYDGNKKDLRDFDKGHLTIADDSLKLFLCSTYRLLQMISSKEPIEVSLTIYRLIIQNNISSAIVLNDIIPHIIKNCQNNDILQELLTIPKHYGKVQMIEGIIKAYPQLSFYMSFV